VLASQIVPNAFLELDDDWATVSRAMIIQRMKKATKK
jgi:hypothetical protein